MPWRSRNVEESKCTSFKRSGVIHTSWECLWMVDLPQEVLPGKFGLLKKLACGFQIPWCSLLIFKFCQDLWHALLWYYKIKCWRYSSLEEPSKTKHVLEHRSGIGDTTNLVWLQLTKFSYHNDKLEKTETYYIFSIVFFLFSCPCPLSAD